MTITVYSKPACVQCTATKAWLKARSIPFTEIDVTQDEAAYARAEATGIRQMPIVIADGCAPFGGFDPDRLAMAEIAQEAETRAAGEEVGAGTITDSDDDLNALCDARRGGKTVRVDLDDL